jgi:hypothetical protein
MVAANGDFRLTYDDCAVNLLAGGIHCDVNDLVGTSTISAIADYPDFRGKHAPVRTTDAATIDWLWGGYKTVTVEPGETEQFVYVVFRAVDRDGFCRVPAGAVSLHPTSQSPPPSPLVLASMPAAKVLAPAPRSKMSTSSSIPMKAASS